MTDKLAIEHLAGGDVACLRFAGTIDEDFAGAATGGAVPPNTGALVLDLGGVRKISSFGIREWVDFLGAARGRAREIVLVECAPKVVDQLNMVANFAAGSRVYSVYAPFRCDFCDQEHRVLLQVDRDADAITAAALPDRPCPACKQAMYFDDDGATFFSYLAAQPRVELSPAVAAFLATRLAYPLPDGTRKLRADKVVDGRATYLRLAGDLDASFPAAKLAEGLEGELFVDVAGVTKIDPPGAAAWRTFIDAATPTIERLWIANASSAFRDTLARPGELGARGQLLDPPTAAPEVIARLAALQGAASASRNSAATLTAPAGAQRATAPTPPAAVVVERRTPLWVPLLAAVLAVGLVVGGYFLYRVITWKDGLGDGAPLWTSTGKASTPQRPAWATEATTCAAAATGGLACTGVSSLAPTSDDAEDEATDAAYDALADALAVKIADPAWRARVLPVFAAARDGKRAALDRDPASTPARREVRDGRRAVAQLARATGGRAVPAAPTGRYWEQRSSGEGVRYTGYAQVALSAEALAAAADAYSHAETALGATVVTAFPSLGWRYPFVTRGAVVTAVAPGPLQDLGLAPGTVVLAVDGRDIADAAGYATLVAAEQAAVAAHGGTLRLKVAAGDNAPRELTHDYPAPAVPTPGPATGPGPAHQDVPVGGINIWDRYGGNRAGSGK